MEVRELRSEYDFPGDDIPIIAGSALAATEGRDEAIGEEKIRELMAAVDEYIPEPPRDSEPTHAVPSLQGQDVVLWFWAPW